MHEIYLNFHGLGTPPARVASEEIIYWLEAERFFTILKLIDDLRPDQQRICITFDDGNKSDIKVALPILKDFNRTAWFFPSSEFLGEPDYLTANDLILLRDAGMEIGSHGTAHARWTDLSDAQLNCELKRSIKTLATVLGINITAVAVPFGAYDRRVLRILKHFCLSTVFTSDQGWAKPNAWLKPRTTIRADTTLEFIERLCTGRLSQRQRLRFFLRRWKRRLR